MKLNNFCALPFMHLATHPNGCVGLCCEMDTLNGKALSQHDSNTRPNNLEKDSLEQIVNSNNFNRYRLEMSNNIWPEPCKVCSRQEEQGMVSKRIKENAKYANTADKQKILLDRMNTDGSLKTIDFEFIELRLGNTCNLACVTCNPISSSRWITDAKKLNEKLPWFENIYTGQNEWHESTEVFADIAKHSTGLKELYINGGEPTLITAHFKMLEELIVTNTAKDINLHYSINCTKIPIELLDMWKQFRHVLVSCSIDEIGDRNSYIRYPSKWEDIVSTFNTLYPYNKTNIDISITQTVSAFNVLRLDIFKNTINELWPNIGIYHNYLHTPSFQQAHTVTNQQKENLIKLGQFVEQLDKIRNTQFSSVFPELDKLIHNAKT